MIDKGFAKSANYELIGLLYKICRRASLLFNLAPDQKSHQINQYTCEVFDLATVVVSTVAEASADVGLPLTVGGRGVGAC